LGGSKGFRLVKNGEMVEVGTGKGKESKSTSSPGWSQKKDHKMVVVWWSIVAKRLDASGYQLVQR